MIYANGTFSASLPTLLYLLIAGLLLVILILFLRIRKQEIYTHSDSITGALNDIGFSAAAEKALSARNSQYVLVAMDLQNYAQILQTFGPEDCNRVLRHLCRVLKGNLSNAEPMGRMYGGMFCFLLKNRQEEAIRVRLARILDNANEFNRNARIPYTLDLVFGISIPGSQSEPLSQMQESAILLAHTKGGTAYRFRTAELDDQPGLKWELIRQIEGSLKNGDFIISLQPKIRLADSRIVGAEAMIRWRHPKKGLLTPEMFIPLLEEYHQTAVLDLYLFEQVCRKLADWTAAGWKPCPISLNLSPETLLAEGRIRDLEGLCNTYGISPEWIEIEMDERFLGEEPQQLTDLIRQLHNGGFRCSLDNFGKTALPLHILRQMELNVDTIKLDRSFFAGENNSRRNRFLVGSILKFATQAQITTLAEGIDNASQVQYLQQAGCDQAQGVYYLRPMSVEEFQNTVYDKGDLRYLTENGERGAVRQTSGSKIIMFSLTLGEDQLVLSEAFSPLLEGKVNISNALDLFRYSGVIHENDRTDFFHLLDRCCKEDGWVENTLRFFTANGRYEWMEVHLHREHGLVDKDIVISGTLVNKAGWSSEVNRWKDKANRDALTGLYNKEHFELSATAILEQDTLVSGAIIFVDIDDFKKVNDTLGHLVGDDVIRCVAKRIFGVFRHTDIVARYGGDEFVVFVNGIARADLIKRLQQLRDGFQFPYRNDSIEYPVSGSIGAAMYPEAGTRYRELLDHADYALYCAKRRGKNQFVLYQPGMEETDIPQTH